jgi:hypothetical protein
MNPSVTYSTGGVYNATLIALNGTTTAMITKTISINPIPNVAVNNQTICSGGTATLNATGATSYTWNTGFVGNPLIVSPPGNTVYAVTGNSLGCIGNNTVSITIGSFLSVYITPNTPTVCAGGSNTLVASGATSYTWNTGPTTTSIVVSPTTTTSYSIVGSNGSCNGNTILTITVIPTPAINLSVAPSTSVCQGSSVTLNASGFYSLYTWASPTITASSITVSPSGSTNYTVTGTGSGGCSTSSVVAITIKPLPTAVVTETDATCNGCPDGIAQASVTSGVAPFTYQWLPFGGTQSLVIGFVPGCYSVNVNSSNGCSSQYTTCIGFATGIKGVAPGFESLKLYPNPASNYLMIEYPEKYFGYALYNNLGQLIASREINYGTTVIQTGELSRGIYTVVVKHGSETIRKKIVIN